MAAPKDWSASRPPSSHDRAPRHRHTRQTRSDSVGVHSVAVLRRHRRRRWSSEVGSVSARTALITGGTSGIGRAAAELLDQQGYQVVVTGQNPENLATARRELPDGVLVLSADARSLTAAGHVA